MKDLCKFYYNDSKKRRVLIDVLSGMGPNWTPLPVMYVNLRESLRRRGLAEFRWWRGEARTPGGPFLGRLTRAGMVLRDRLMVSEIRKAARQGPEALAEIRKRFGIG